MVNRFLLGFEKNMIRRNPHEKIAGFCLKMEMPEDFLAAFLENLPEANIVGFGLYPQKYLLGHQKLYLDFSYRI